MPPPVVGQKRHLRPAGTDHRRVGPGESPRRGKYLGRPSPCRYLNPRGGLCQEFRAFYRRLIARTRRSGLARPACLTKVIVIMALRVPDRLFTASRALPRLRLPEPRPNTTEALIALARAWGVTMVAV